MLSFLYVYVIQAVQCRRESKPVKLVIDGDLKGYLRRLSMRLLTCLMYRLVECLVTPVLDLFARSRAEYRGVGLRSACAASDNVCQLSIERISMR